MEYLLLGTIIDSFGIDGTLRIFSTTNNGKKRYRKGATVFLRDRNEEFVKELTVLSYRSSGRFDYVRFKEVTNPEEGKLFKGFDLCVVKDRSDLDVGYYYYSDLVDCKVIDEQGNALGIVSKVEEFPAQLTLRVKRSGKADFFVPFINQFIIKVDIEKKEIQINVIEGML